MSTFFIKKFTFFDVIADVFYLNAEIFEKNTDNPQQSKVKKSKV